MKIVCAFSMLAIASALTPVIAQVNRGGAAPTSPKTSNVATSLTAPTPAQGSDEVLARVGSREIRRKELDLAVQGVENQYARGGRPITQDQIPALEHRILDAMIGHELVLQEGLAHPPTNVDAKVQEQLDMEETRMGGADGLTNALREAGVTPSQYRKRTRENVIVQETMKAVFDREIKITPAEVKAYYDSHRDQMKQPASVRVSHILMRVPPDASDDSKSAKRAQIEAARTLVKNGQRFADVARKVSEDPGSASNGGDLGFIFPGQMVPQFETVAFSLKTNELSDVVPTAYGYHLILVTDRKPAQEKSFDEVEKSIENFLRSSKSAELADQHVKQLRDNAQVAVYLKPLATPTNSLPGAAASQPPKVTTPPIPAPKP